jgi:hypothetical protein
MTRDDQRALISTERTTNSSRVYLRGDLEIPPDGGTRVDSGWFNSSHWNRCRPLNASRGPLKERQRAARPWVNLIHSWRGAVRLAVAIGVSYFLASRLGMFFRAEPEGLAVFSPAAGIATGALIAFGAAARLPAASAVVCATIACSLIVQPHDGQKPLACNPSQSR